MGGYELSSKIVCKAGETCARARWTCATITAGSEPGSTDNGLSIWIRCPPTPSQGQLTEHP